MAAPGADLAILIAAMGGAGAPPSAISGR
ncbi:uncharacterized protein METZ01_LOCUS503637, partial [marine metagenome]